MKSSALKNRVINKSALTRIKSGVYILVMKSETQVKSATRKFGDTLLNKGYYYYAGSAQKNFHHRILRHLRKDKIIHWHIDLLSTRKEFTIISVMIIPEADKSYEQKLAGDLEFYFGCSIPFEGFGNSDSKESKSHLFFSKKQIPYSHFISRYQSIVRFKPSSSETSWR